MSRGDWRKRFTYFIRGRPPGSPLTWWELSRFFGWVSTTAFSILILFVFSQGIWDWYLTNREIAYSYNERVADSRKKAIEHIAESCAIPGAPSDIVGMCLKDKIETYRQQSVSDQDLEAQQEMAWWTAVMGIVGIVGVPLNILGLFALWLSLRQTRTAIRDTREIGEAEVRAYIAIENSKERPFSLEKIEAGKPVAVSFRYNNNGSSHARRVTYVAFCEVRDHPIVSHHPVLVAPAPNQVISPNAVQGGDGAYGEAFTEGPLSKTDIEDITESAGKRLYMMCRIEYDDVFDKRHYTHGCFYLEFALQTGVNDRKILKAQWFVAASHNDAD
jgi:hypothetical protein